MPTIRRLVEERAYCDECGHELFADGGIRNEGGGTEYRHRCCNTDCRRNREWSYWLKRTYPRKKAS